VRLPTRYRSRFHVDFFNEGHERCWAIEDEKLSDILLI
jgi:hypothetical protein